MELIAARAVDRAKEDFLEKAAAIYASYSGMGRLHSGSTILAAFKEMERAVGSALSSLLADVGNVARTDEAFAEIESAVQRIFKSLGPEVGEVVRMAGQVPGSSASSAAYGHYLDVKKTIEADLIIARHNFLRADSYERKLAKVPSPPNRGGKPLAAHWDEMWAAIAIQLWAGDLQPKTQAEITRAMLAWFSAQDIDVGDTAVTERARRLWLQIEATK
ncbi:hypothetical protein [Parafrankia sp. BMG5.11]|uniref:hypothetical protein n=1 Tax=Parafrankia sp. BMG5.11 TaxID=222540 RepID=UPI0010E1055A|nr:hypothetical protein [Parafrankia sp. BMG5.11]TCJ37378.1 hypothetical protein E0504_20285 [Parafrankia sp. BMG5.11]